ncbi:unnamed protein product [Durusdinium trenchii]|uniref:Uncharacterized protein n=1 Tax=Durusdinium trenchii TaxID=1381693 RepID=A0ABP0ILW9_9DINO
MACRCRRRRPSGYRGGVAQGQRDGYGELRLTNGTVYMGQWELGVRCGHGEWHHPTKGHYVGEWKNNQMHGHGCLKTASGASYEGHWREGRFHEEGELRWTDGTFYAGSWRKGQEHGLGRLSFPDGKIYEGLWVRGEVEGHGTLTYADARKRYVGQFRSAKPHGHGRMVYADGLSYEGQWQYGLPAGKGKWNTPEGQAQELTPVSSVRPSPREDFIIGFEEEIVESSEEGKFEALDQQLSLDAQGSPRPASAPRSSKPGLPKQRLGGLPLSNPLSARSSWLLLSAWHTCQRWPHSHWPVSLGRASQWRSGRLPCWIGWRGRCSKLQWMKGLPAWLYGPCHGRSLTCAAPSVWCSPRAGGSPR